jgi:hypothetical protein
MPDEEEPKKGEEVDEEDEVEDESDDEEEEPKPKAKPKVTRKDIRRAVKKELRKLRAKDDDDGVDEADDAWEEDRRYQATQRRLARLEGKGTGRMSAGDWVLATLGIAAVAVALSWETIRERLRI